MLRLLEMKKRYIIALNSKFMCLNYLDYQKNIKNIISQTDLKQAVKTIQDRNRGYFACILLGYAFGKAKGKKCFVDCECK